MKKTIKLFMLVAVVAILMTATFAVSGNAENFTLASGATANASSAWGTPAGTAFNPEGNHHPDRLLNEDINIGEGTTNRNSRWAPYREDATPWFYIDLGQTRSISRITMVEWRSGGTEEEPVFRATGFRIYVSTAATGDDWTHIHTGTTIGADFEHSFTARDARRVRVTFQIAEFTIGQQPTIHHIGIFGAGGGGGTGDGGGGGGNEAPAHVAVTSITGVPTTATAGTNRPLSPTVVPATATNRTITWSVVTPGGTGASVNAQGQLVTTGAGTVTLRATIAGGGENATTPHTQEFTIVVSAADSGTPNTGEPVVILVSLAVAVMAVTGMVVLSKKTKIKV